MPAMGARPAAQADGPELGQARLRCALLQCAYRNVNGEIGKRQGVLSWLSALRNPLLWRECHARDDGAWVGQLSTAATLQTHLRGGHTRARTAPTPHPPQAYAEQHVSCREAVLQRGTRGEGAAERARPESGIFARKSRLSTHAAGTNREEPRNICESGDGRLRARQRHALRHLPRNTAQLPARADGKQREAQPPSHNAQRGPHSASWLLERDAACNRSEIERVRVASAMWRFRSSSHSRRRAAQAAATHRPRRSMCTRPTWLLLLLATSPAGYVRSAAR